MPSLMHNKIVADEAVLTGSFNLSHSAMENADNALVLHDKELAVHARRTVVSQFES